MPIVGSVAFSGKAKATTPGQAGTPSIVSQASGQVGLSWTAPSFSGGAPISDYKIEYSSNGGSSWTTWSHAASTSTSQTVTGLTDYLTYIFRVSAINAVGFGITSSNSAGAAQFNAASGGSETTISNYNGTGQTWKVHQFSSSGSLTISRSIQNYRVLVVGQGGAGGAVANSRGGGSGGGGAVNDTTATISAGSYSASIGWPSSFAGISANGGNNGGAYNTGGNYGGSSGNGYPGGSASTDTWWGGGGGGAGGAGGHGDGKPAAGGPGVSSNITGSSVSYGAGGGISASGVPGNSGASGIVVVSYRIA